MNVLYKIETLSELPERVIDMTGMIKGRLTVTGLYGRYTAPSGAKCLYWNCVCSCGNSIVVSKSNLHANSSTISCGCLKKENSIRHVTNLNKTLHTKHGKSNHRLYDCWRGITQRILNPNDKDYPNYGGRGINIDNRWLPPADIGFENFLKDMENSYIEGFTLDRLNNNGNYCKENCKWVVIQEQSYNRRNNLPLPNAYLDGVNYKSMFTYKGVNYYLGMFPTQEGAFIRAITFRRENNIPIPPRLLNLYEGLLDESLG